MGGVAVLEGGDDGGVGPDGVGDACALSRCQLGEFGGRVALVGVALLGVVAFARCGCDDGGHASDENNQVLHCR